MNQFYAVLLHCCPLFAATAPFPPRHFAVTPTAPVNLILLNHFRLMQTAHPNWNPATDHMTGQSVVDARCLVSALLGTLPIRQTRDLHSDITGSVIALSTADARVNNSKVYHSFAQSIDN